MRDFARPRIFCSQCLGFDKCRWNGVTTNNSLVEGLKKYADFITECPEMAIGLGSPRSPVRLVKQGGSKRMLQHGTLRDVTQEMADFSESFLSRMERVDGFIMKGQSPSCGLADARLYSGMEKSGTVSSRESGLFAYSVKKLFSGVMMEDDLRLRNCGIKEHFLTAIFTFADFRRAEKYASMKNLVDFHTRNKFLLIGYSQSEMQSMGRIVANKESMPVADALTIYRQHLSKAFARQPKRLSMLNMAEHIYGYFSGYLNQGEKRVFRDAIEDYREGRATLYSLTSILSSWSQRFNNRYVMSQTVLEPYPKVFASICSPFREE
jgi:uncharacterized protein YbgA (DUF1722 family)/uncharacterized protein YbbK (DUF523 family)